MKSLDAGLNSKNEKYSVFYTLSDIRRYPRFIDKSLESIEKFVEPKNIIIVYTPPLNTEHIEKLKSRGYQVHIKPKPEVDWRFAAKNYLCDVETENLFFIDCDTIIYKDIIQLLSENNYLFAARVGRTSSVGNEVWENTFEKFNLKPLPMFNSGFMIFRKNLHNQIKKDWMKYLKMYLSCELEMPHKDRTMINQHALTLAISQHVPEPRIWYLGEEHHSYTENKDTYVYHKLGMTHNIK